MPQRIRAGCDRGHEAYSCDIQLCHSAFARVATSFLRCYSAVFFLCHSAFARVATSLKHLSSMYCGFATAHSRGLRRRRKAGLPAADPLPQRIRAGYDLFGRCRAGLPRPLPQRIRAGYDAPTPSRRIGKTTLPQRIRAGYDVVGLINGRLSSLCHSAFARVTTAEKQCSALRICCEKVDSFSSVGESGLALTIFPFSFAAKATYVAINDSFGRAIDRFFWCEPHRN